MNKKIFTLIIAVILLFAGCGKKSAQFDSSQAPGNNIQKSAQGEQSGDKTLDQSNDKMIIITSSLTVLVDDIQTASNMINSKSSQIGGYVEREDVYENSAYSIFRIPAQKTEEFINYVEESYDTRNKSTAREDITEQYVDNDARIKNLRAEENQVIDIMKKANTVEEILKVQDELYRIRGEIESLEAKKKLWDNQTGYSTITINFQTKSTISKNKISIISSGDFFKAISSGFINSLVGLIYGLQKLIIFIISNIVSLAIMGILIYVIVRVIKKQGSKDETEEVKDKHEGEEK